MRVIYPEPSETTVEKQVSTLGPSEHPHADRPFVAVNFAMTLDGRATINGRSGPIGSAVDSQMLHGLRSRFDAVMIGAGTLRAERYGRIIRDPQVRARRERLGLPHDPLAVIVSGRLDIPWDAPIFTDGGGRVLIFTRSDSEPPETATSMRIVRQADGVDLSDAMRHLRVERGVRSVLCEGGSILHAQLQAAGLVDEVFLTIAPKLSGGPALSILEGELPQVAELELVWVLESEGEIFTRYRRRV